MKKVYYITIEFLYFFLLSVPLAITIYILLHVGLFIYVIYKQIKSLCQRITTK
jgi:hypothetical protein